jgi:hypothetical protein
MIVGHARVSTSLTAAGAEKVFAEKVSGAVTDRKALGKAIVRFGRKLKLSHHQIREALARREAGEALADIGRSYNVSHSTISRL